MQVVLDPGTGVQARGQPVGEPEHDVHQRHASRLSDQLGGERERPQRQQRALARELEQVEVEQVAEVDVFEGRLALTGDDFHHLLGRHAVGAQRGDEGPGGGAQVDVELVDRAVHRQQVERPQGTDLIHPPGEAAAAEHERGLAAPGTPAAIDRSGAPNAAGGEPAGPLLRRRLALGGRFQLDNLAHARNILRRVPPKRPPTPSILLASAARSGPRSRRRHAAACPSRGAMRQLHPGRRGARRGPGGHGNLAGLQSDLGHQLALAGSSSGAYVYDLTAKAGAVLRASHRAASAGLGREALHRRHGACPDGPLGAHRHDRARPRPPGAGRRVGRQPVPARRRRPDLRQHSLHPRALWR